MEILLEPTSNKLLVDIPLMRTSKHGKTNTSVLEEPTLWELKPCQGDSLNLPDHRAQFDQESQIKMYKSRDDARNDHKNSKSKDKAKIRSQSNDDQSHYKQDKTKTKAKTSGGCDKIDLSSDWLDLLYLG
ncbi:hypothetical protein Tco_0792209 [Tanacetum coccineum]